MGPSVLHVTQTTHAGVARCVLDLASDQVARGWRVGVVSPDTDAFPAQVRAAGAAHHVWAARRQPGVATLSELRPLARVVAASGADLVHLHSSKAGLVGRLVVRGRRPTLFQPNGWSFLGAGSRAERAAAVVWERAAARWTTTLICVSEREMHDGIAVGVKARWRVVPNAVDVDTFRFADDHARRQARTRLGLDDSPLVLCVARLTRQKGQNVLLRAWPQVQDSVPSARLVLVGDGPDREHLQAMASGDVTFTGVRTDVADWMAAADVVVLPSRWEGMSYVMLEAMASGRSVVASDVGGAREAIGERDGRAAGALVPVEDAASLAEGVAARLDDRELSAAEGRAGARRARDRHDLREWCEAMTDIAFAAISTARRLSST